MNEYVVIWIDSDGAIGRTIKCHPHEKAIDQAAKLSELNGHILTLDRSNYLEMNDEINFADGSSVHVVFLEGPL